MFECKFLLEHEIQDSTRYSHVVHYAFEHAWRSSAQLPLRALDGKFIRGLQELPGVCSARIPDLRLVH